MARLRAAGCTSEAIVLLLVETLPQLSDLTSAAFILRTVLFNELVEAKITRGGRQHYLLRLDTRAKSFSLVDVSIRSLALSCSLLVVVIYVLTMVIVSRLALRRFTHLLLMGATAIIVIAALVGRVLLSHHTPITFSSITAVGA